MNSELLKVAITPAFRAFVQVIASKYALSGEQSEAVVGSLAIIATVAWSVWEKKKIQQEASK